MKIGPFTIPPKRVILYLSVFLGLSMWIIDSFLDAYFFYKDDFFDLLFFQIPGHEVYVRIFILISFLLFGIIANRIINKLEQVDAQNRQLIKELKEASANIKVLSGLLPICSSCKKIRDDDGYWNQIELYIRKHSEADFSHGICPHCLQEHYPEYAEEIDLR